MLANPVQQRLRRASYLGGYGFYGRPLGRMIASRLGNHAHGSLANLRGKLDWFLHRGSILSRSGASTKPGAVHIDELNYLRMENAYLKKLDALVQANKKSAQPKKRK
jgi:hypothetical protein